MLSKERDASKYRNKGKRNTSVKTVYGEVEYERRVYQTRLADGTKAHVYLLDRYMGVEKNRLNIYQSGRKKSLIQLRNSRTGHLRRY